jgi:hypothetical protein
MAVSRTVASSIIESPLGKAGKNVFFAESLALRRAACHSVDSNVLYETMIEFCQYRWFVEGSLSISGIIEQTHGYSTVGQLRPNPTRFAGAPLKRGL